MNTATNNMAGTTAVAVSSRDRADNAAYRSASWSAHSIFGGAAIATMTPICHKTTRPRPLEPSP